MTQGIQQKIKQFGKALEDLGVPFSSLYLFGSNARGTAHEWSDIDVAVVGPAFAKDRIDETVRLSVIASKIDPAFSPVAMRPEDVQDRFSMIGTAIRKEGIEIK